MKEKWLKAAEAYNQRNLVKQAAEALAKQPEKSGGQSISDVEQNIKIATDNLQTFLQSDEGFAALVLLTMSGKHIVFSEDRPGGGFASVYFLDGDGLQVSVEPSGMWIAYQTEIPKPNIKPTTARAVITTTVYEERKQPNEILPWLRNELNKIADAIG